MAPTDIRSEGSPQAPRTDNQEGVGVLALCSALGGGACLDMTAGAPAAALFPESSFAAGLMPGYLAP